MENDKAQSKEAKHKRVFFWFGDEGTVEGEPHRALRIRRKTSGRSVATEGSRKEVADGLVDQSGAHPGRRGSAGIGQIAPGDTNSKVICSTTILIHKKVRDGSAAAANSDGRSVGGASGKSDVGSAAARNSGSHRIDVYGISAGKQGRKREVDIAGLVGVENVSVIIYLPRVYAVKIVETCGSDALALKRGGGSAKDPKGLVGGVVLAGIDADD